MRARNVKPSLFKNELLATSDPLNTWIFEGLWCLADREGRLEDRPRRIHLEINPGRAYEGTEAALVWLAEHGFILRYEHGSGQYIQIVNFGKHQNPHPREAASDIPAPSADVWKPQEHETNERTSPEAVEWARAVKARDGKCVDCGATKRLHAHHVIPWENEATRYDLTNGVTLCAACHAEQHPELPARRLINGSVHGQPPAQPKQDQGHAKAMPGPALSPFPFPDSPSLEKDMAAKRPFVRFWEGYPKKVKRKDAEKVWQSKRLDPSAELLISDVSRRLTEDRRWLGGFIPDPPTYLRGERWNDAIEPIQKNGNGQHAADTAAKEHAQILDLASMFGIEQGEDDWSTFKARVDRANGLRLASMGRT